MALPISVLCIAVAGILSPDGFLSKTLCDNDYAVDGAVYEYFRFNPGTSGWCSLTRTVTHGFGAECVADLEERL